jgi:hypothetical protein
MDTIPQYPMPVVDFGVLQHSQELDHPAVLARLDDLESRYEEVEIAFRDAS